MRHRKSQVALREIRRRKEIKAFLKNIRSAIGDASRKQVLRELGKKFTEEEILEIERRLAEAAKSMGEPPPPFLPPP